MANLDGFQRYAVERFCSQVEQDDPINLPLGVQAVARNAKFVLTKIRSRDGINKRIGAAWVGMDMGTGQPVTGLYSFKFSGNGVTPDKQVPMVYDQNGNLKIESPPGSGILIPVTSPSLALPANSYLQADASINRAYLAFTNIANPVLQSSVNAVYDLSTGILDPHGMKQVGAAWVPNTPYVVGECVTPIQGGNGLANGKLFRCTTAGTSGAVEPTWNPADDTVTAEAGPSTVQWTENTPIFSTTVPPVDQIVGPVSTLGSSGVFPNPGSPASGFVVKGVSPGVGGAWPAGQDVYIAATLINGNGETNAYTPQGSPSAVMVNTLLNSQMTVTVTATIRAWLSGLAGAAKPTGWNLYVASVATGAAAPALASYLKMAGGPFALAVNTVVTVNSPPAGAAAPSANTASLVNGVGNVDAGSRWMIVLFQNRNGYISGYSTPSAVNSSAGVGGFKIQALKIPLGPTPHTQKRYCCFSLGGATSAGPYAYVPLSDLANGVNITTTIIPDNVTTTAAFNFTDIYLTDLLATTANVQAFFDKIQLPPCRAVIHSPTMDRMIYLTYNLPSGAYITPQLDPETIFGSTGLVQISETDGQNVMGWVHFDGIEWALKEESGHEVNPSADNPSNWQTVQKWTGRGPCGLRAYAVGAHFFGFVHKSGVYLNFGAKPEWISKELGSSDDKTQTTWKRINWNAKATIWMQIDDDTHEIRVGVPLDNATVPSHVLKCNFAESIEVAPAIHSTIYSRGKFIASAAARKWSIDTIAANSFIRAKRTVLNPPPGLDAGTTISQLMYASSFDSSINSITPGVFTDNGNLIDFVCEGVAPAEALKESRLGGVQALIGGSGSITVEVLVGSARAAADGGVNVKQKEIRLKDAYVKPGVITSYTGQQEGRGERFRVRFSTTGKPAGTWFELEQYALYINPVFQVQASGAK